MLAPATLYQIEMHRKKRLKRRKLKVGGPYKSEILKISGIAMKISLQTKTRKKNRMLIFLKSRK